MQYIVLRHDITDHLSNYSSFGPFPTRELAEGWIESIFGKLTLDDFGDYCSHEDGEPMATIVTLAEPH